MVRKVRDRTGHPPIVKDFGRASMCLTETRPQPRSPRPKKQTRHRANKHAFGRSHSTVGGVRGRDLDLRGDNDVFACRAPLTAECRQRQPQADAVVPTIPTPSTSPRCVAYVYGDNAMRASGVANKKQSLSGACARADNLSFSQLRKNSHWKRWFLRVSAQRPYQRPNRIARADLVSRLGQTCKWIRSRRGSQVGV